MAAVNRKINKKISGNDRNKCYGENEIEGYVGKPSIRSHSGTGLVVVYLKSLKWNS